MKSIYLFGGGPHINSCIEIINQFKDFKIVGIVEKNNKANLTNKQNIPIIIQKKLNYKLKNLHAHISIGNYKHRDLRKKLFNELVKKFKMPSIISKYSYISKNSKIGDGTIIMNGCVINSNVTIGKNCIINSGSIIEHDTIVKDHCIISPGVIINGKVNVGELSFIGSGSIIVDNLNLPNKSFIKANQLVKK
jgi:sugar O-acyltransferase (sialic acid O-acetyltransferase NeuD family)